MRQNHNVQRAENNMAMGTKIHPPSQLEFHPRRRDGKPKNISNRSEAISIQLSGTACTSLHGPIQTLKPHGLRESESAHKESA